jgi:hypothetical protein
MAKHVSIHPRAGDPSRECEVALSTNSAVPVHPVGTPVEQDWPTTPAPGCTLDGSRDGRRERRQEVLVALAAH